VLVEGSCDIGTNVLTPLPYRRENNKKKINTNAKRMTKTKPVTMTMAKTIKKGKDKRQRQKTKTNARNLDCCSWFHEALFLSELKKGCRNDSFCLAAWIRARLGVRVRVGVVGVRVRVRFRVWAMVGYGKIEG
jgi:hypothetical protein